MNNLIECLRDLVIANRILAREGVVDGYGHISLRHPDKPDRFLMSRSRSPELVTMDDLLEHGLDGEPVAADAPPVYLERFIHAAVFEAQPDANVVVHSHAPELIPFGVTDVPLRPIFHTAARMGTHVPVWDMREKFGDTNLLVVNMDQARDLAATLAGNRVALMRGHGNVIAAPNLNAAVMTAIYTQRNALLQMQAMQMGEVTYLSPGEVETASALAPKGTLGANRTWEYFRHRAGCDDI
jgi:HCOMODA/2-hydroxy-3-carboxy-muconic semialdehyde decarboxylase